jgi:glycerol-3-phosphate dehydrogenase
MVKGSHIVVDKLYDHDRCYIFQNADGRICFAIPYEQNFTLIGTTDRTIRAIPESAEDLGCRDGLPAGPVSEYFRHAGDARAMCAGPMPASAAL